MTDRRTFLAALSLLTPLAAGAQDPAPAGGRPPLNRRSFRSPAIEEVISRVRERIGPGGLFPMFENCFPNTADTTVRMGWNAGRPDAFVITGDIEAMWLRDSSAQVWSYLPFARGDEALTSLFRGLIHRQARCILLDPYANAFQREPSSPTLPWARNDSTLMKPGIAERKWELDSLCHCVRLAHGYWRASGGDIDPFDDEWREAMRLVLRTLREQQRKTDDGPYTFQRRGDNPIDTLPNRGYGAPGRRVGLIHSGFRPSDDACTLPFHVPANHFAVISLRQLAGMAPYVGLEGDFVRECMRLADEVHVALAQHATMRLPDGPRVWAYEVDGFGGAIFLDDANAPSLLSMPYLGACKADDPLYLATREAALSAANPYFVSGREAQGIGSPHTPGPMVWPMSIALRGLTSRDEAESRACLETLARTSAGTHLMHESFHADDASKFTRPWFAWANALFSELVLRSLGMFPVS